MPSGTQRNISGYDPGHPWFYHLGGTPLTLKQIRENVRARGYRGYKANDIAAVDRKAEPQRSAELRRLRTTFMADLEADVSRFREVVRGLRQHRLRELNVSAALCHEANASVSLKHNHLSNDFAHLNFLDELLNRQGDLFGF